MIKIDKPAQIPITLRKRGVTETQNDRNKVEQNHKEFLLGDKKLDEAISEVYGSDPVKRSLIACHNGKCCYCERKRDRVEIDVEHFRPKGAVTENAIIDNTFKMLIRLINNKLLRSCGVSAKRKPEMVIFFQT